MPRTALALAALLLLAGCGGGDAAPAAATDADVRIAEANAAEAEAPARVAELDADAEPDSAAPPAVPKASRATAREALDVDGAGDPIAPVRGVEVCDELKPALLAMRVDAYDLDLYAAEAVVAELRRNMSFRDPETGESRPEDVASWVDDGHPGTCSLSAGGDAWHRLTLRPLTGGRGDYATAITMTTSYAEGGP